VDLNHRSQGYEPTALAVFSLRSAGSPEWASSSLEEFIYLGLGFSIENPSIPLTSALFPLRFGSRNLILRALFKSIVTFCILKKTLLSFL
jgi:hypothetical protein